MAQSRPGRKPAIQIARSDHEILSRLADAIVTSNPTVSDELATELDRARVVADQRLPGNVVRMGSRLRYSTDAGEQREVALVLPAEADIAQGRISILTPIGAALIGLSEGQSIEWTARDGRNHLLTVDSVSNDGIGEPAPGKPGMRKAS